MKFLIENYANSFDTQALYLHQALLSSGVESVLWESNSSSVYDIMDKENPDYYITTASRLSKDFAHYTNNNKKIKLLLNVDYITGQIIMNLEESIINSDIECCFFFSSKYNVKTKKIRFVHLNNAHDNNLAKQSNSVIYSIDKAIFVNSYKDCEKHEDTYHFISNDQKLKEKIDIVLPEHMLFSLYRNYREIIFKNMNNSYVPQSFFDAIIFGNKVYCKDIDEKTSEMLSKVFRLDGQSFDYNSSNRIEDFEPIRSIIQEKHLPVNRAKTILSQIPKGAK